MQGKHIPAQESIISFMRPATIRISAIKIYGIPALLLPILLTFVLHWQFPLGLLVSWIISANLTAFLFYGLDKLQALHHHRRVPENLLHGLVLAGGWVGGLGGMLLFNHKIRKGSFQRVFWTITGVEMAAIWILIWFGYV